MVRRWSAVQVRSTAPAYLRMKNFFAKIISVIVCGSLIGGTLFYFWKNKYAAPAKVEATAEKTGGIKEGENPKSSAENAKQKSGEGDKIADGRQAEIISYIEKNINNLAGQKPSMGGNWHASKIWFIDEKNFYVDYKDDAANLRRILVFQAASGRDAVYEVLGHFAPGDSGWVLESGKDMADKTPFRLYEKNEQIGEWAIK